MHYFKTLERSWLKRSQALLLREGVSRPPEMGEGTRPQKSEFCQRQDMQVRGKAGLEAPELEMSM